MNMQKPGTELDEGELERFIPKTVQKRMALLRGNVAELNRRKFRSLDENNPDDLKKVISIIEELHPESTSAKVKEYAKVSIQLWRKQRSSNQ
jgi:hypothetical protein